MAEAQVRKLEQERDRLSAELRTLNEAISTRAACEELIKSIERAPEPFSADQHKDNPWATTNAAAGGCCSIQ